MGGGGDDYSARQAEVEARKQQARDALNAMFGVAPTGGVTEFDRERFMLPGSSQEVRDDETGYTRQMWVPGGFDQAAYEAARGGTAADVAKNKADRDSLYATVRDDAFNAGKRRFDEDKTKAARDLKFTLFAQGLNGGSADVDENALLNRTYEQGLLDLGAKADAARTDMMGSDENTRLGLLQSIDSGMDQGSALSSALNQLKVNSDRAASQAQGTALGDLFGGAGLLYTKSNAARGKQDATDWFSAMGYPSYPFSGGSRTPRGAASGVITPT